MAEQIKYGRYLHGGDYNPEQWLDRPDILQKVLILAEILYQKLSMRQEKHLHLIS